MRFGVSPSTTRKRRAYDWRQALLLVVAGLTIGISSFSQIDIWGSGRGGNQSLYAIAFLMALAAFISGLPIFAAIAVKNLTSLLSASSAPGPGLTSSSPATDVARLRIALIAALVLAILAAAGVGFPPLNSPYGRSYLLSALLTLIVSQAPYAAALIRTWNIADRAGLSLAVVAGSTQTLSTLSFFSFLEYRAALHQPWQWPRAAVAVVATVLACLAWRSSGARKGDLGLLISTTSGFLVYTVIAQIGLAVFSSHFHVP